MSFVRRSPGADCTWLDGRCHPYGAVLAYLPVIDLVKQYFRIDASDRDEDIRRKVYDGLGQLGMALEANCPVSVAPAGCRDRGTCTGRAIA